MILENSHILKLLIESCCKGKRSSQDELYKMMYNYGMSICLRYAKSKEEAHEILNDASVKIFRNLNTYTEGNSFKGWIRKIYINAAIDHFRKNEKHYQTLDIAHADGEYIVAESLDQFLEQEILNAIHQLPPVYRTTFNLYAIEGYKHHEIADMLAVSESTSRSNLAKARVKLQKMLLKMDYGNTKRHG